jgi:hypothetical protein
MNSQEYIQALRDQLAILRARHDSGAMSAATYATVRDLETEIAWQEHRAAMKANRGAHLE